MAVAIVAVALVSCKKGPEAQAEEYYKQIIEATKTGDMAKIQAVTAEASKWEESLTADEKKAVEAAGPEIQKKYEKELQEATAEMEKKLTGGK